MYHFIKDCVHLNIFKYILRRTFRIFKYISCAHLISYYLDLDLLEKTKAYRSFSILYILSEINTL